MCIHELGKCVSSALRETKKANISSDLFACYGYCCQNDRPKKIKMLSMRFENIGGPHPTTKKCICKHAFALFLSVEGYFVHIRYFFGCVCVSFLRVIIDGLFTP